MTPTAQEIIDQVNVIRTEMRFFSGKAIPNYSKQTSSKVIERFEYELRNCRQKLKLIESDGIKRQKVIRELFRLVTDLRLFDESVEHSSQSDIEREKNVPVLFPLKKLSDLLTKRPTVRTN